MNAAPGSTASRSKVSRSELLAVETQALGGRRRLWWAFGIALAPLAVLMGLQYSWLTDLQEKSSTAETAQIRTISDKVGKEVNKYYRNLMEKTFSMSADLVVDKDPEALVKHFKKAASPAVRYYVLANLSSAAEPRFFSANGELLPGAPTVDEWGVVRVSLATWRELWAQRRTMDLAEIFREDAVQGQSLYVFPILDAHHVPIGLGGVFLDEDFFLQQVLLPAVKSNAPRVFEKDCTRLMVYRMNWSDNKNKADILIGDPAWGEPPESAHRFRMPFWFASYIVAIWDPELTPFQWAARNFYINLSLSIVLSLTLLGGLIFVLRSASREMRLSTLKSDFVSNVSHELRTPLASIRVFGELMRIGRVKQPEKISEYGAFIESESRRLTQLVDNILDFSRIESGRQRYTFTEAELVGDVQDAVSVFVTGLRRPDFQIECIPPKEKLPPVHLDQAAFGRAIGNLLDNAVKYSGDSRRILVRVRRNGESAAVDIQDFGIGIPLEEQARVFERFHRVGSSLVHEVRGVGLGLSIVRNIVEAHGGRIELESAPGRGSTFSIILPLDRKPAERASDAEAETSPLSASEKSWAKESSHE